MMTEPEQYASVRYLVDDVQAAVGLLSGAGDLVWEARALHWRAAVYLAMGHIERADLDCARSRPCTPNAASY